MLSKEWRKKNLKALGFDTVKQFQKWVLITADGVYGKTTDKYLSKVSKYAKNRLSKQKGVKAKMLLSSDKMGTGTVKAIKEYEKSQGEGKLEGRLNKADRSRLGLEKVLPTKAVFYWQNRSGSINWDKVKKLGFDKTEFYCHDGCGIGPGKMNPYVIYAAIKVREKFFKKKDGTYYPMIITSPYRCAKNNMLAGGVPRSEHKYGNAVDFSGEATKTKAKREEIKKYIRTLSHYNYTYSDANNMGTSIHMDFRR